MYEPDAEYSVKTGAAFLSNNLSVMWHEPRALTYAAFLGKNVIQFLTWNEKMEQQSCDLVTGKEKANGNVPSADNIPREREKPSTLMQVKLCLPLNRINPIAVVLSSTNVNLIDPKTRKSIFCMDSAEVVESENPATGKISLKACVFSRGITCVENLILAGTNAGEIIVIMCVGETNFQQKKSLKEHDAPITDMATCGFDLITVTGDVDGNVVVWSKGMKSVTKKISTNQQLSVLNILRKQVLCGTYIGQVFIFSITTGSLMAEVNAHSRQITSIAVAVESAYILTASEDSYIRIWKLHTRKPDAYKVEFRFAQKFDNMSIMGAEFSGPRGSGFVVSHYENTKISSFRINKRPPIASFEANEAGKET
ncbi:WD repeat-containing protein 54 [Ditylenchus destructor]|uniref:WD repeat-containing protein 54 n=1 Tax=Ditylenchus destructor TaxID=166010 RepID=A0AAD4QZH2_9BILA|nr:WD repeat-containing protein 54 [Ditylenchus destructor]